jgi:hypothetical protein
MLNEAKSRLSSGKKTIFFRFTICSLLFGVCYAQWQPDVRLTNDAAYSLTSYNNAWCVAANVNVVHVIWMDSRDGGDNYEIYYKRSTDGGVNWGADKRLTSDSSFSGFPSVSVSGQVVHVVWFDRRDGNYEIYYKRSTDGGVSWQTDTRLTNNSASSELPSVSVSGQVVHVVWHDKRDGIGEIYYKRSTDGGVSWQSDTRLTNDPAQSDFPSISVSGLVVHVVWHDARIVNYPQIYYKHSTDGGINWGADTRLTNYEDDSLWPCIAVSGQAVHVVWTDRRDGNSEIYYKLSRDSGVSWEADTRLTNNSAVSINPTVSVSGQVIHVVWEDGRNPAGIYYKRSTDGGKSWGSDTRLSNSPARSEYPSISVSGQVVHVVWRDERDGNWEVYYKRNPTGNFVGITNINSELPMDFSLSQNYPNPFNPITKIKFALPKSSFAKLVVYDIIGSEVATLVNESLKPGNYEVSFDGSNVVSGIYLYKLQMGEFIETKKMILLK